MGVAVKKESYPYIVRNPGIAGGTPIIKGTRVTIRCVAGYCQMGMSVDDILNTLAHLTPSQVHSALAYYFDNKEEIERDLEESSDVEVWKRQVKSHPKKKTA